MINAERKSSTDLHWNERAGSGIVADEKVNIGDTKQRELETAFVLSLLNKDQRILEVGCGNGHLTRILRDHVAFVDAFDYSESMIARAHSYAGETNNRFFCDNVLMPKNVEPPYDAIVCVRVLINLRDLAEQQVAIENLSKLLKPNGKLILIEGYRDGFEALSAARTQVGLPPLTPAAINYYSLLSDLRPTMSAHFTTGATFHTGMFDFLTRVVYPSLVGADKVQEAGDFHQKTLPIASACNLDAMAPFARLHGFELIKR